MVAFVAGIFKERATGPGNRKCDRPGTGKRFRVIRGEFVINRIHGPDREAFDIPHVLTFTGKRPGTVKVGDLDDESVTFPVRARVALPMSDVCGDVLATAR